MFCKHCGTKIKDGVNFCQDCGKATTEEVSVANSTTDENSSDIVKCRDCKYTGVGELSRRTISQIFAWLSIFVSPLITLGYYEYTYKYQCPKCQSTSLDVKAGNGEFLNQKRTKIYTKVIIWIFVGMIGLGIIYSLVSSI
jgi:uncharacterized membrane protein YvbJ